MNPVLTRARLRERVPSAFAERPHGRVSDKYVFIPTVDIIDGMEKLDYYPVSANESVPRKDENVGTQRHMIRFRHADFLDKQNIDVDDLFPEIVWENGHDGRTRASMLGGLYRLICSNGLTVPQSLFSNISEKHIGIDVSVLEQAVFNFVEISGDILSKANDYRKVEMNTDAKKAFAHSAHKVAWPGGNFLNPERLLGVRRIEDRNKNDLFTVFNVVQENVQKGGIEYRTEKRRVKTKSIESVKRENEVNVGLWALMDNYYKKLR